MGYGGVMFAKNYLLQMKDNVARSVRSKLEKGEYPANSPIGYINYRDQNDNSRIVLDPDRAHQSLLKNITNLHPHHMGYFANDFHLVQ